MVWLLSADARRILFQTAEGKRWLVRQDVVDAAYTALKALDSYHEAMEKLQRLYAAKSDECDSFLSKLANMVQENATLREQLVKAEQDHNSLLAEVESLQATEKELRNEVTLLGTLRDDAANLANDRLGENHLLRVDVKKLTNERNDLRMRLDAVLKEHQEERNRLLMQVDEASNCCEADRVRANEYKKILQLVGPDIADVLRRMDEVASEAVENDEELPF